MSETETRTEKHAGQATCWRSVDQLADMWGMDAARTRLVVGALLDNGRMEQQIPRPRQTVYRLVG